MRWLIAITYLTTANLALDDGIDELLQADIRRQLIDIIDWYWTLLPNNQEEVNHGVAKDDC